jgi:predicted negative regulator of RcsB-dependent stress response
LKGEIIVNNSEEKNDLIEKNNRQFEETFKKVNENIEERCKLIDKVVGNVDKVVEKISIPSDKINEEIKKLLEERIERMNFLSKKLDKAFKENNKEDVEKYFNQIVAELSSNLLLLNKEELI